MTKDDIIRMALEAWDDPMGMKDLCVVMDAIRTALEQPTVQESLTVKHPVAWAIYDRRGGSKSLHWHESHAPDGDATKFDAVPLYTAPFAAQSAQRKPLTDEQIGKAWAIANGEHNASGAVKRKITRAIEAAHGIKEET